MSDIPYQDHVSEVRTEIDRADRAEREAISLRLEGMREHGLRLAERDVQAPWGDLDESARHVIDRMQDERDEARSALENVRMLVATRDGRWRPGDADHLLRFCASAGVQGSILRAGESS